MVKDERVCRTSARLRGCTQTRRVWMGICFISCHPRVTETARAAFQGSQGEQKTRPGEGLGREEMRPAGRGTPSHREAGAFRGSGGNWVEHPADQEVVGMGGRREEGGREDRQGG